MTEKNGWNGYWPASITPFKKDLEVDFSAIRALCDLYRQQGVHGVLVNGSSGEWYAQTAEERSRVAKEFISGVNSSFPVVVGCSSFSPAETVSLANDALQHGADGVCFTPPPYARPDNRETQAFFENVCSAINGPVMVYNWPRGTGIDLTNDLMLKLEQIANVKSIKDSTSDYWKHMKLLPRTGGGISYFGSYISEIGSCAITRFGGSGSIEGGSVGAVYGVPYFESVWRGDLDTAQHYASKYSAFLSDMIHEDYSGRFATQVSQIKAAMQLLGQPGGYLRPPLLPPTERGLEDIATTLRRHAILQ